MQDEEREATGTADATESASEGRTAKAKAKREGPDKSRRSHGERAVANIRAAKKGQREVSDPVERARFLLAEANVLALLELADALGGSSGTDTEQPAGEPAPSE
jgi:hypothetical protein